MSSIVIAGNTSGAITIAAPAEAGLNTLTLPASTGTLATTADIPAGGKILQVVNLVYSTQSSMTIGTTDTAITGMNLNITPLGAGSKFRIDVRLFGEMADQQNTIYNLHRNGTRVNTTSNLKYHGLSMATLTFGVAVNNSSTPEIMHFATVDSTGSTAGSAITYTLTASTTSNNMTSTQWINRCFLTPTHAFETGISEIIITEIGA